MTHRIPFTALIPLALTAATGCFLDPSEGAGVEQGVPDPRLIGDDGPRGQGGADGQGGTGSIASGGAGPETGGLNGAATSPTPYEPGPGPGTGGSTGSGGPTGPTQLVSLSSTVQAAAPGADVAAPPAFRLEDGDGNPIANAAIMLTLDADEGTFSVGGRPLTATTVTTDAQGEVHLSGWTLPKLSGASTLEVDAPGTPGVATLTYTAEGSSNFEVRIEPVGSMTPSQLAVFERARRRWEAVIVNALSALPTTLSDLAAGCGINSGVSGSAITTSGVVIFAEITAIDGPGSVLGSAGPCLVRTGDHAPVAGLMRFDSADVANLENAGSFEAVILHEMGHVLGVGTLWDLEGFLQNPSLPASPGADTHHTGARSLAAFNAIGGQTYAAGTKVPVENSAIPGSGDGHWRESVATNELMTPYLNAGPAPLSQLTIGSIDDFPYYTANYAAADAFSLGPNLSAPGPIPATKACNVLRPVSVSGFAPAGTIPAFP